MTSSLCRPARLVACCLPLCTLILPARLPAQATTQASRAEVVAGRVLDAASGQPLAHALVNLVKIGSEQPQATAFTGDDGRFRFASAVPAGKYRLVGEAARHVAAAYQQHGQFSTAIVTGAGLPVDQLELSLPPEAAIVGRITDEDGEPVPQATVSLYRQSFESGTREVKPFGTVFVEADGRYRFDHLPPGQYFLSATGTPWYATYPPFESADVPELLQPSVDPALNVAYPTTFYPAAHRSEDAAPLPVTTGEQLTANLQLTPQPAVSLTLSVPTSENGVADSSSFLTETVFGREMRVRLVLQMRPGAQRLPGLAPGHYHLHTDGGKPNQMPSSDAVDLSSGSVLRDAPIRQGQSVVTVQLRRSGEPVPPKTVVILAPTADDESRLSDTADSAGRVSFRDVPAGEYSLLLTNDAGRLSIGALAGEPATAVHGQHLVVEGAGTTHLVLSVAAPGRALEGFVHVGGKPLGGAMVLLIPAQASPDPDQIRRDQSDLDGSFTLPDVPPGDYLLLALSDAWSFPWADLHRLAPYLQQAQPVRVLQETAHAAMRLRQPVTAQPVP